MVDNNINHSEITNQVPLELKAEQTSSAAASPAAAVDNVRAVLISNFNQLLATTLTQPAVAPEMDDDSDTFFGELTKVLEEITNNVNWITILETRPVPSPKPDPSTFDKAEDKPPVEEDESKASNNNTVELTADMNHSMNTLIDKYM